MSNDLNFDRAQYTASRPGDLPPEFDRANPGDAAFLRAILFGLGAAILGSILYAAFTIVTHIVIGYVALGVGYGIGKAMMAGSNRRGGRNYQVAAAILTYLSVSMSAVVQILWRLHREGAPIGRLPARTILLLARYGVSSPFLGLTRGVGGFIGLFILFIAIRAAWRLTSASLATASHPFNAS